ncbi:PTS transporter subunit EIIB [Paenibacillus sp. FSL H8-0317]|uniref:PTS transporter subunit EIIB n=1 Tax=unclassified Paenibacillus TaxID=185978 RepID=UPI003864C5D1
MFRVYPLGSHVDSVENVNSMVHCITRLRFQFKEGDNWICLIKSLHFRRVFCGVVLRLPIKLKGLTWPMVRD